MRGGATYTTCTDRRGWSPADSFDDWLLGDASTPGAGSEHRRHGQVPSPQGNTTVHALAAIAAHTSAAPPQLLQSGRKGKRIVVVDPKGSLYSMDGGMKLKKKFDLTKLVQVTKRRGLCVCVCCGLAAPPHTRLCSLCVCRLRPATPATLASTLCSPMKVGCHSIRDTAQ